MSCCFGEIPKDEVETVKSRTCTDRCWLILFAICWIILSGAAFYSFSAGNPSRLIHGYDSFGNICGQKNTRIEGISWSGLDMRDCPYVFHMNPVNISYSMKICVKQCADKNMTSDGDLALFYQRSGSSLFRYDYDLNERNLESFYVGVRKGDILEARTKDEQRGFGPGPKTPVIKQRPLLNRCVAVGRIKLGDSIVNNVYSYLKNMDVAHKIVSDIYSTYSRIALSVLFSVGISILITFSIHLFASVVSVLIMLISTVTLVGLVGYLWYVFFNLKSNVSLLSSRDSIDDLFNEKVFLVFAIIVTFIVALILFITYLMRSRVSLMVALFDQAANCIRSMPALIFQPLWTSAVLLLFLSFWTSVLLGISTAEKDIRYNSTTTRFQLELPARSVISYNRGNVTFSPTANQYYLESVKHEQPQIVKYLLYFLVLMLFWSSEFILGCQQMTVASSVASWYFTRDKTNLTCPIGNSIKRVARFHLGSIALGSLLIVLFKIPRLILSYLEYYLKQYKEKNGCIDCTLKCCHFMWYCLENFLSYVNQNAYTIIAIEGINYCPSAKIAFKTLAANTIRIITINSMGDFIIFLGKCIVTSSTAAFALFLVKGDQSVHFLAVPIIFAAIVSYLVAHSMLSVYEMVIDTMFLCFIEDVQKNASSQDGYFAPEGLLKFAQEDGADLKPRPLAIADELNVTRQPKSETSYPNKARNGGGDLEAFRPSAPNPGFVYPNLVESSH